MNFTAVKESFLVFSVEALFQIFDLVKGLMHPNSKIFDFVNLTAEIVDYPKLSFLISRFSRLCLFLVIQFSRYFCTFVLCSFFTSMLHCALLIQMVENKGLEPLTPCVQGRCSPS